MDLGWVEPLEILFRTKKLEKQCLDSKVANKQLGADQATKLSRRRDDMRAAANLGVLRPPFPGRCHELKADRAGQLSIDLVDPYRLVFVPSADPPPQKPDAGLDWDLVTSVTIIGIEDTHG